MRTYEFIVVIQEGNDEFWEGLDTFDVKTIEDCVREAIEDSFPYDSDVALIKFLYKRMNDE